MGQENQFKRVVAKIVSSRIFTDGDFISEDNFSNYILFHSEKIFKINLIGIVVEKNEGNNFISFLIDDGFSTVEVRAFGDAFLFKSIIIGSCVLIVGRPRLWQEKIYLNADFIKIVDPLWAKHRKLLIGKTEKLSTKVVTEPVNVKEIKKTEKKFVSESKADKVSDTPKVNLIDLILEAVKELDSGDGADTEAIISKIGDSKVEALIDNLINEGEIFEFKPGRLKCL